MKWWEVDKKHADLERELRSDLELEEEEQRQRGLSPDAARAAARRAFGNQTQIAEQTREEWSALPFERALQDVRFGLRQLRKHSGFAAACIFTVALGVGATTAIYSVVDSLLLRPLPYPNSSRIVGVWNTFAPRGMTEIPASEPEFLAYRQSRTLAHVAAYSVGAVTLTGNGDPLRLAASWGTSDFFSVTGSQPIAGRLFTADEEQPGHNQVAILSHRLWQSRFGLDPAVIGRSIVLNGQDCTVVGVMPPNFDFPASDVDVWQPLSIAPASSNLGNHYLDMIAELQPAASLEQAGVELNTLLKGIEGKYSAYYAGAAGLGVSLIPLRQQMVGNLRPTVLVLMAGVGFVLLIACTNVAGLLLARGEDRRREMATRIALGAARSRILGQVLLENMLLFLAGGTLGVLAALAGVRLIAAGDYLRLAEFGGAKIDIRVLAFATFVTLVSGLCFGCLSAFKAARSNISDELKTGGRDGLGSSRQRVRSRSLLVMTEITFSLVLLTGAGLMIRSLVQLLRIDLGFAPANAVTMRLSLPEARYPLDRTVRFYRELQDRVRGVPGVRAVAIVNQLPMSDITANASFEVEGSPSQSDINIADTQIISPDYFRAMGMSLRSGRFFSDQDASRPPASVIVNQTFARKIWPGANPIGKRIRLRSDAPWLSVVGVVADIKNHGPSVATKPELYVLHTDQPIGIWADLRSMTLVVRTALDPEQVASAIRVQLRQLDPDLPVYRVSTLEQRVASSVSETRFPALTLSLFAGTALILAGIGVYGVLAYTIAQRRHDIGLRMALGAQRSHIVRSFIGQGLRWASVGGIVGIAGALLLVRFMRTMLFEVSAYDPGFLLAVAAVLFAVVFLASFLPALQAVKIDPMIALRND